MIKVQEIQKHLSVRASKITVKTFDVVDSTNTVIKEIADVDNEVLVISSAQTKGRGRLGRSFFSPDETGLYMSLLVRPKFSPSISALLTSAAAVATSKAIEKVSDKKTEIKWINDIYIDSKKVCGILCESAFCNNNTEINYVIVGIGINLCIPEDGFPEDIQNIATSVFGNKKPSDDIICRLCAEIVNNLLDYCDKLDERAFIEEYKKRSFVIGKDINVISSNSTYQAIAKDIDDDAHLIVTLPDGTQRTLSFGEISIRTISNEK